MPESETEYLDYYPAGWTEEVYEAQFVEWIYDADSDIFVRLDGSMGADDYSVSAITGINSRGEEFVARARSQLSEEEAYETAAILMYAMNGVAGRISGEPEFNGK